MSSPNLDSRSSGPARDSRRRAAAAALGLALACLVPLAGCSSGGGDGDAPSGGNGAGAPDPGGGQVPTVLPRGNEPNTRSVALVEGADGALHAAYSDIAGRLFYARCDGGCDAPGGWRAALVSESDADFTVPKLALAPGDVPIVAAHRADTFDPGITSVAACTGDCLTPEGWFSTDVRAHGVPHLQRALEDGDWFALDADGRPRMAFLEKDGLVSFDEARLRLIGCDANCNDAASWRERDVVTADLRSATPASLAVGADGDVRLTVPLRPIGGDVSRLVHLECAGDCLEPSAPWSDPLALAERADGAFELNETALALGPDGRPVVALYDGAEPPRLAVHRCVGDCASPAGWTVLEVPPAAPSGVLRGAGAGVDARFEGTTLELGFVADRRAAPLPDALVVARCDAACLDGAGPWSETVVASTAGVAFDAPPTCFYVGTSTRAPVSLTRSGAGLVTSPQWTCGTEPVEVTDAEGNVFVDNAADLRFFEFASFAARR